MIVLGDHVQPTTSGTLDRPIYRLVQGQHGADVTMVWFGLVYWGVTPQQQPGSYQGGEMMMMKSVAMSQCRNDVTIERFRSHSRERPAYAGAVKRSRTR